MSSGQHDVEQDKIGNGFPGNPEARATVPRMDDVVPGFEGAFVPSRDSLQRLAIFDQKYSHV